jgi:hypothetical protein
MLKRGQGRRDNGEEGAGGVVSRIVQIVLTKLLALPSHAGKVVASLTEQVHGISENGRRLLLGTQFAGHSFHHSTKSISQPKGKVLLTQDAARQANAEHLPTSDEGKPRGFLATISMNSTSSQNPRLTPQQVQQYRTDGFVKLPGVVPAEVWKAARRAINAGLGASGIDPEKLPTYRSQTYLPELQNTDAIRDLYNATPITSIMESLVGAGKVAPVGGGQIALRFPSAGGEVRPPGAHIDGMYSPNNGVPKGTIHNFTALVGVFLSDVPEEGCGNFTVWPGSHLKHAEHFRENGSQSLLGGMPPVDIGPPHQVTARAGDAVIAHYLLGHGVAGNVSPDVRYAIFFRVTHVDHEKMRWESMTDPWLEWEGVR